MTAQLRRFLLANLRDLRVLFREFRVTLALFAVLVLGGAGVLDRFYVDPVSGRGLGPAQSVYALFCLIFVQPIVPFPEAWPLQVLFFAAPILGLGLLAEGIVRFAVLVIHKQARREEWQVALASTFSDHIVVCGVGRLGFRIVEQLLACGEEDDPARIPPPRRLHLPSGERV